MKVSVIVPVYNVEDYIEKCLLSIQKQTLKDFECLIIDDGSPDNSIEKAKAGDAQSHDGTASEGNLESLGHARFHRCIGRADVALGRYVHTEESGENGKKGSADIQNRALPVNRKPDNQKKYSDDDNHNPVLSLEECECTFPYVP